MGEWKTEPIKSVVSLISGRTVNKKIERPSGEILYVKVGDMNLLGNETELVTSSRFVDRKDINDNQIIALGAVVFPKRGGAIATNKKRVIVKPTIVDLNTMAIVAKDDILPEYLKYWMLKIDLNEISNGTSIPQINNYSFDDLMISFPTSKPEQKRLVHLLDTAFAEIERARVLLERNLVNAGELFESRLGEVFSSTNKAFKRTKIKDVVDLISGQHIDSSSYNNDSIGIGYLTGPSDFGDMYPKVTKWTPVPKRTALKGDILITVKGSGVGSINMMKDSELCISRQLMAIRCSDISKEYLYLFMSLQYQYFQNLATGAAIPGISREDVLNLEVSFPGKQQQSKIVKTLEKFRDEIGAIKTNYQAQLNHLTELKQSLLAKAFAGEL